jgi:hypothetical protein
MSAGERPKWSPGGGLERPHIEEMPAPRRLRTEDSGARNGLPEWRPYVRNPAIKARESAVNAQLAAIHRQIGAAKCPECAALYWVKDGHKCG